MKRGKIFVSYLRHSLQCLNGSSELPLCQRGKHHPHSRVRVADHIFQLTSSRKIHGMALAQTGKSLRGIANFGKHSHQEEEQFVIDLKMPPTQCFGYDEN